MAYEGRGTTDNNFLQWDATKRTWVSTVEAAYLHLQTISSSGEAVVLPANGSDWTPFVPVGGWVFAKGASSWLLDGTGVRTVGNPTPYLNRWMELEVKASAFISGFPATDPQIAFAVAQNSDSVAGTSTFPKFEQRVEFTGPVSTNVMQFSFKNAILYTHSGIQIFARHLGSVAGALNVNFLTAQMTIKPL